LESLFESSLLNFGDDFKVPAAGFFSLTVFFATGTSVDGALDSEGFAVSGVDEDWLGAFSIAGSVSDLSADFLASQPMNTSKISKHEKVERIFIMDWVFVLIIVANFIGLQAVVAANGVVFSVHPSK
jgi:hypothetical protein